MEIDYGNIEFTPILREDTLTKFKEFCREEYIDFMKTFAIFADVDKFLNSKCQEGDNSSIQYFTRIMNIRVKDHFSSSIILISQGYTVDALSLTRASLEDLFVILNFYLEPGYFGKWKANKRSFKIVPAELRTHPKIDPDDQKLYQKVYKLLSNSIVHPRIDSLSHMLKYHPTAYSEGSEGVIQLKKDTRLINLSFFVYLHNLCRLLKLEYKDKVDEENLDDILNQLKSLHIGLVKYFDN
ncbi:hypothetical protein [Neobacillus citreus]|uniref:Uncharacterized protein n=1 Tax=Neobacillus citreus TaxID=2833578 RepID=A0A942T829_9BACI|nr:hypothetical protein [Neobacillus citreus]MCH6265083.1 hypothetical protein [Neobacillus citreus]